MYTFAENDSKLGPNEALNNEKNGHVEKSTSMTNQDLLDQIPVPPLTPEDRVAISCNCGVPYTPAELGAVPEEDEEIATSSTPSTVVRWRKQTSFKFSLETITGNSFRLNEGSLREIRKFAGNEISKQTKKVASQVSPARAPLLIEGRDRTLSFHERATSKDVIDELNRMIRKGEDSSGNQDSRIALDKLDLACCCPTGWVHVEREIDFTDPKVS